MNLYETTDNPVPPGAIVSAVRTRDGLTLRVARWTKRETRGTVTVLTGRSEFIETYFGVIRSLLVRDFDVVVMDWRGQGQSDREIEQERRGYVSDFNGYRLDLEALETQVLNPYARHPWFAFGHSMGAAMLLDQAHDGETPFQRLFLSAPMIGLPVRFKRVVQAYVRIADRLGLGTRLVPGGSEEPIFIRRFDGNVLTTDRLQYRRLASATKELPRLAVGAPTIRWLKGAFALMDRMTADPRFAVEILTPVLIGAAGEDRIVDTAAIERFALGLKVGRCLTLAGARHQVMMERPDIDAQMWAAFDAFIPGEAGDEYGDASSRRQEALAPS